MDVYAWAMRRDQSIDNDQSIDIDGHVRGILLIDEVEQHLHPSMQRGIIQSLKDLFPGIQILASTHSPLVVQGVEHHEIISLHRSGTGVSSANLDDYSGFSVEDLLTASELFNTPPYSLELEEIREKYHLLMAKSELSSSERDQLRSFGQKLARLRILAPQNEDETLDRLEARLSELANDPS